MSSAFSGRLEGHPRLTLNLGLRYDYFTPLVEANNRQSNFDYATGTLITAGVERSF